MNSVSLMYWNDRLQGSQPRITTLLFSITAAKTVTDVLRSPTLTAFDVISTQATIDNFLGTTTEFALAAFDATAMGTDAFACIVNMNGQAAELYAAEVRVFSTTGGATETIRVVEDVTTLTASSLTTECARGSSGNIAVRSVVTGLDILTAGVIQVQLIWRSK